MGIFEMVDLSRFKDSDEGHGLDELTELTVTVQAGYDYSWARKRALLLRKCFWLIDDHRISLEVAEGLRDGDLECIASKLSGAYWRTYREMFDRLRSLLSQRDDAFDQDLVRFHGALSGVGLFDRHIGCMWNEGVRRGENSMVGDEDESDTVMETCNFLRWGEKCSIHDPVDPLELTEHEREELGDCLKRLTSSIFTLGDYPDLEMDDGKELKSLGSQRLVMSPGVFSDVDETYGSVELESAV
jgi:hypothetical protein